jgi:hypothetical protein
MFPGASRCSTSSHAPFNLTGDAMHLLHVPQYQGIESTCFTISPLQLKAIRACEGRKIFSSNDTQSEAPLVLAGPSLTSLYVFPPSPLLFLILLCTPNSNQASTDNNNSTILKTITHQYFQPSTFYLRTKIQPHTMQLNFALLIALANLALVFGGLIPPPRNSSDPTHKPIKRWYTVQPIDSQDAGPWPVTVKDPNNGNQQAVRYCFADSASEESLSGMVVDAIAKWQPVFTGTALNIILDPGLPDQGNPICDTIPGVIDALVIFDNSATEGASASTTRGYDYANPQETKRNYMNFAFDEEEDYDTTVATMAHELGKAEAALLSVIFNAKAYKK